MSSRNDSQDSRTVKPTTDGFIKQLYTDLHTYSVSRPIRGRILLINNEEFETSVNSDQINLDDRIGSEIDKNELVRVFKQLNFDVLVQENVSGKKILSLLELESQDPVYEIYSIFILVILSHGDQRGIIYGSDCRPVSLKNILRRINNKNFKLMAGKPKIIISQTCAGKKMERVAYSEYKTDGNVNIRTPDCYLTGENLDFYVMQASLPGYVSLRSERSGSLMIRCLVDVLYEHACHDTIEQIVNKTRSQVLSKCLENHRIFNDFGLQTVYCWSTLTKSLYMFPGHDPADTENNETGNDQPSDNIDCPTKPTAAEHKHGNPEENLKILEDTVRSEKTTSKPERRSCRTKKKPEYLKNYVTS